MLLDAFLTGYHCILENIVADTMTLLVYTNEKHFAFNKRKRQRKLVEVI